MPYNLSDIKINKEMSVNLKERYIATRFSVDKDAWPPDQPEEYTTLTLIHRKNQPTQKQVVALAKAKGTGNIANIVSASCGVSSHTDSSGAIDTEVLSQLLKETNSTHEISDILASLEDPNCKHKRMVLIEGAPGLGKTVLLKQIAYEWAQGNQLTNSHLVFLLMLRDTAVRDISSIEKLVKYFYAKSEDTCKVYADLISETNGRNITFLLDGYDELPQKERLPKNKDPSKEEEESFIAKIIGHKILPLSAVVISSRPHASIDLRSNAVCQVDILGFTKDDQLSFFQNSLKGQPGKLQDLLSYLDDHPNISSLCYIPFYMTVLLWLFKLGISLPNSSAKLYNCFICHTIQHHLAKHKISVRNFTDLDSLPQDYKKIIQQLSVLCLTTLETKDLTFSLEQIKSYCPEIDTFPGAINGFGLLQAVEYYSQDSMLMGAPTKTLNFIHLSVQEFLAAYQITCLPPNEELNFIRTNFFSEDYSNVFSLYVGLTMGQRPCFKKFLYGKSTNAIDARFTEHDRSSLRLFQCFYEANDFKSCNDITKKICSLQKILLYRNASLFPSDIHCLTLFLSQSSIEKWQKLDLQYCHMGDTGLTVLNQSLASVYTTIDWIFFWCNSLTMQSSEAIVEIAESCKTKKLDVSKNNMKDGLDLSSNSTLEVLYMSWTCLTSSGASRVFTTLTRNKNTRLRELSINGNNVDDKAVTDIAQFLTQNSVLEKLDVRFNSLTAEGIFTIVCSLNNNRTLRKLMIDFIYMYHPELAPQIYTEEKMINKYRSEETEFRVIYL